MKTGGLTYISPGWALCNSAFLVWLRAEHGGKMALLTHPVSLGHGTGLESWILDSGFGSNRVCKQLNPFNPTPHTKLLLVFILNIKKKKKLDKIVPGTF